MDDLIGFLEKLGDGGIFLGICVGLWHFVFKDLVDNWLRAKTENHAQEIAISLQMQRDLAQKDIEFEKIKLERILPLLENINHILSEHKMMYNTYLSLIINKGGLPDDYESDRVEIDGQFIEAMCSLSIYLPPEFRTLIYQLRKIISCSWKTPSLVYYELFESTDYEHTKMVIKCSQDIYSDLVYCFYDMTQLFLGLNKTDLSFQDIIHKHKFTSELKPKAAVPEIMYAWHKIIFHEYSTLDELHDASADLIKSFQTKQHTESV